ncbi:MAG: sugar-binding protein, partial [Thermoguttaceae bacterium]
EDKRTVKITVVATKALDEKQKEVSYVVRDYWGAEQGPAAEMALGPPRREGKNYVYDAEIDLGGAGLETGRYYELHADIFREGDEPFHNYTSLAILPPAATKKYKPAEIPFTSRSWDNRIGECFYLSDRLGVRICGIWGGWPAEPPYAPYAPTIELCEKLGMGVLTGSAASAIEHHDPGWEKYDEKALRQGVRNWIEKYGKIRPLMIDLGNEPPLNPERVKANIAAYKAIYEEVKKVDPSIIVIASSMGPVEEYFKNGFQNYCDVVDFHAYEDWAAIPGVFETYEKLFAKYGGKKPIWSTEIGLNSQGMVRQAVAATLVKKLTLFFASGGQNICWFDLLYPDGDAKLAGSSSEAHNIFDARYSRYCPKLDAVAYYNMVNGLSIKKFAAQKTYEGGARAFLFRDRDNRCLEVLWKDKGRADVLLPLPGAGKATLIAIDGRRSELDAGGKGLTLTVSEDPVLLLYQCAAGQLPDRLGTPAARIASLPEGIIKGGASSLTVSLDGVAEQDVELIGPAFWAIQRGAATKDAAGAARLAFTVRVPENSSARECDLMVKLNGGAGQLHARLPVTGRVATRLLPVVATGDKPAGVRLLIRNYAAEKQDVTWRLALTGEISPMNGEFGGFTTTSAYFADVAEGTKTLEGKGVAEIVVPLAGIDPLTVYRVKAGVSDSSGRTVVNERPVAGFAAVPRARAPIKLDGSMAEADWKRAPVQNINEARQYFAYDRQKTQWKGKSDLSGTVQFLWDDKYLYVGVKVLDDVFANNKVDGDLWAGDGLQFMVDPAREALEKPGKYDIAAAITSKGPQVWCYLSADSRAPEGQVKDVILCGRRAGAERGDMTYELAIPWSRVAPFQPAMGANLGLCVVLNEDDGLGRVGFMGWFGDVQSKRIDTVGDLILGP